jgi:hypothetical protein
MNLNRHHLYRRERHNPRMLSSLIGLKTVCQFVRIKYLSIFNHFKGNLPNSQHRSHDLIANIDHMTLLPVMVPCFICQGKSHGLFV